MVSKRPTNDVPDENFSDEVKYDKTTAKSGGSGGARFRDNVAFALFLGTMMYVGALFNTTGGERSAPSLPHAPSGGTGSANKVVPVEQLLVEKESIVDPVIGDTGEAPIHQDVQDSIVNESGVEGDVVGVGSGDNPEVTVTHEFPFHREPVRVLPAYAVKPTQPPKIHRWTPGEYIAVNSEVPMPNELQELQGQDREPLFIEAGTRSEHYGDIQRRRQHSLNEKAQHILRYPENERNRAFISGSLEGGIATDRRRIEVLQQGVKLWGATYVPAIEPGRRQQLIEKWSPPGLTEGNAGRKDRNFGSKGRILYVITSFDRGTNHEWSAGSSLDKLDFVLMMMDEMREACELGFSPYVHLITTWDSGRVNDLIRDRIFCERTDEYIPYSHEKHPPDIGELLYVKHRRFMRNHLQNFDVFIETEDDMIVTLNHILLYLEHSQKLQQRTGDKPDFTTMPGFIRVEPAAESGGSIDKGGEWYEWDIIFSRIYGTHIRGAGAYMVLGGSFMLPKGGNEQGMWMATRDQVLHLSDKCEYFNYSRETTTGRRDVNGGSLEMFQKCAVEKVFPANEFEGFLVHHRTNNKSGRRGESNPAVPISMLRLLSEQYLRDDYYLKPIYRRR